MGLEIGALAGLLTAGVGAASFIMGMEARKDQKEAQEKIIGEQKAGAAAQAALERRQQVREERVRRARILQAGENTGTANSSGEAGAIGGLSTTLASNIGFNLGAIQRANNISTFQQDNIDAQFDAQLADSIFSVSTSIFQASGGIGNFKK